eukprot:6742353-Pyramimonas_sp.AAC.1
MKTLCRIISPYLRRICTVNTALLTHFRRKCVVFAEYSGILASAVLKAHGPHQRGAGSEALTPWPSFAPSCSALSSAPPPPSNTGR